MIGMIRAKTIITVAIFSVIHVFTIDGQKDSLNWFEAQEKCQGRGLTTETTGMNNREYWTGRYIRLSQWIKIIGCYPDSNITNHYPRVDVIMEGKFVGACQEICKNENSSTFAVKLNRCTCLKGLVNFHSMFEYSPSHCNYSCDSIDGIYSRECGGETAYNLYISDQVDSPTTGENCMVLQCSSANNIFMNRDCSEYYNQNCQKQNSSNKIFYAANWSQSMERCKESELSSYLYGNFDLTNASGSCLSISNGYSASLNWIGIARQSYTNEDQGWMIEDFEKAYFLRCQKCTSGNCTFSSCKDTIRTEPFCSIKMTTNSTDLDQNPTTIISLPQSLTAGEIAATTMSTSSTYEESSLKINDTSPQATIIYKSATNSRSYNNQGLIGVVICGIIVVILTGIVIFLIIYIIRIKKRTHSSDNNKKSFTSDSASVVTNDRPSSAYTTLNPGHVNDINEQHYTGLSKVSEYIEMH